MRVVHLGKYYPPATGGIESHTRTLARAQAAAGADVSVVVVNHAGTRTVDETDGPVPVVRVGRRAAVGKLDVAPGLGRVLRALLRDPPDVWHLHAPNPTMLVAAAVAGLRPVVVTHHSDVVRQRVAGHLVRPLERWVYRRAARVLATSADYAEGSDRLREFRGKVAVVPLGIDLAPYRHPSLGAVAAADRFRRAYRPPLWLAVGRLVYYKGLPVAVAALPAVPGTLVVVGTGPLEAALKKQAAALGVNGRIAWLGRATADELAGAYRAATALWFPSVARSEAFGLVQVEAMASGCPVVNAAVPGSGVGWVCRDGREGLTVPVGDPAALAAAANRLLSEPGLRGRLAAAGVDRVTAEFDHRAMADRVLAVYREAVR